MLSTETGDHTDVKHATNIIKLRMKEQNKNKMIAKATTKALSLSTTFAG